MQLPYPEEWSPRQRRQKTGLMSFSPLVGYPKWKVEMQCSGSLPLAKMPRIDFPETPGFNKKVPTANGAGISNQRGPAHNTNNFVPNEYREVVNPSGLVVYKGSNASDNSDR